jgi:hypothetical protein
LIPYTGDAVAHAASLLFHTLFEMAVRQILAEEGFIVKLIDESG